MMRDMSNNNELWIFGYGSVIWKHAEIAHTRRIEGFIHGYKRRFWQHSHDHRGTSVAPGRVVSVYSRAEYTRLGVTHEDERRASRDEGWAVHGVAFLVAESQRSAVLSALHARETGGYVAQWLPVYRGDHHASRAAVVADACQVLVPRALTFVACCTGDHFAGFAPHAHIATQIARSRGESGENVEYLSMLHLALARMGRVDAHVAELYALCCGHALLVNGLAHRRLVARRARR
ncbi:unnamed protein product [Agarophyton chilense]